MAGKFNPEMDGETRQKILAFAKSRGVKLISVGVVTPARQDWPKWFAFAKDMGLQNIASEPPQDTLALVDQLSRQSGITVAIHNHPRPSRYWDPAIALAALQPYGPNLGVCADTGHWARSGLVPTECLKKTKGRILECHFKDLDRPQEKGLDVPWGTGSSDAGAQLAELRRQGFTGVVLIEYENRPPGYEQELRRCVDFFHLAMKSPLADLEAGRVLPPKSTNQ
jgi:sugar phosphate isomerase/epimerase